MSLGVIVEALCLGVISDVPGHVDSRHAVPRLLLRLPPAERRQQQPAVVRGHQGCHSQWSDRERERERGGWGGRGERELELFIVSNT